MSFDSQLAFIGQKLASIFLKPVLPKAEQLDMIKSCSDLQTETIQNIFRLAERLHENSDRSQQDLVLVTKKYGLSSDKLKAGYVYARFDDHKVHLISSPNNSVVKVYISPRGTDFQSPAEGVSATFKIFNKSLRIDVDFENETVEVKPASRLRPKIASIADDSNKMTRCYKRFLHEVTVLKALAGAQGVSAIWDECRYQGSHNGVNIPKITFFGELYPGGDLFNFNETYPWDNLSRQERRGELLSLYKDLSGILLSLKERGYIHCDIKPENILLDGERKVFLNDFEFAVNKEKLDPKKRYGCSPEYLSPERFFQLSFGEAGDCVSHASDMWSMGMIFYELYVQGMNNSMLFLRERFNLSEASMRIARLSYYIQNMMTETLEPEKGKLLRAQFEGKYVGLDRLIRRTSSKFVQMSSLFDDLRKIPSSLPLPFLPGDEVIGEEGKYANTFLHEESTNLIEFIEDTISCLDKLEQLQAYGIDLSPLVYELIDMHRHAQNLVYKFEVLLKSGWDEWDKLPLSEDPMVAIIQRMLKVHPEERITPEELKVALDQIQE